MPRETELRQGDQERAVRLVREPAGNYPSEFTAIKAAGLSGGAASSSFGVRRSCTLAVTQGCANVWPVLRHSYPAGARQAGQARPGGPCASCLRSSRTADQEPSQAKGSTSLERRADDGQESSDLSGQASVTKNQAGP
jgi:hypothetical protein